MQEKSLSLKRFGQNRNSPQPIDLVQIVDTISPPAKPNKSKQSFPRSLESLTPRNKLFIRYYRISHNATDAAKKAGYSKKTAYSIGSSLLRNSVIAGEISRLDRQTIERLEFTADEALQKLGNQARANMQDFFKIGHQGQPILDWANLTRDQADALQELTVEEFVDGRSDKRKVRRVKFKLADKQGAIELWGKFKGAFVEKHQHDHKHSGVVGVLLAEIDQEGRGGPVIEHQDGDGEK